MKQFLLVFFILLGGFFFLAEDVSALAYHLIAPQGNLTRGGNAQFTVEIDTEGETIKAALIGMSYEKQYLQFINATPGNSMTSIKITNQTENTFQMEGSNPAGFSGQGIFAYVNFKIIADAPGNTQLCALWGPSGTPALNPTQPPNQPTAPVPTSLPKSGQVAHTNLLVLAGAGLIAFSLFTYLLFNESFAGYKSVPNRQKKKHHKK